MLTAIGIFIAFFSSLVAYLAPGLFDLETGLAREISWCILIVGTSAGIQIALFPFSSVFVATQRFDLSNLIGVATRLTSAVAIWFALERGYGLLGLSIVTAASNIIDYTIRWRISYRLLPEMQLRRELVSMENAKELLFFGLWSFLISIYFSILLYTDTILIGLFMPVAAVTTYALAANLIIYIGQMLAVARTVFYPVATELHAQGEVDGLQTLLFNGSRFLLLAAILIAIVAGFWVEDFFRLWIGTGEIGEEGLQEVVLLVRVLAVSVVVEFVSGTAGQILLGSGRVKILAVIALSQALTNLLVTVALIPVLGLLGAAVGTLVAALTHRPVWTVILVSRQLSTKLPSYAWKVLPRPLLVGALFGASAYLVRVLGPARTWTQLMTQGALAGALGLSLALLVGIDPSERQQLLLRARGWLGSGS